ncbi:hypothetical protein FNW02_20205 [Komarekiella sp. 'clone 1']|uniref:Uncharacterized protein n=1 Tax=Komarekiella delphini-convector SJRDD-AB1 TaxID=2593771 RepID=A0AA40SZZ9_9NOST|nr:hypothetical protein [Komarekiella delphini-convector]MBD6618085.1 hypothetical protein [Komarekiella delphini-convector SJRDD-AB1]
MPITRIKPLFTELTVEESDMVRGGAPVAVVNPDGTVTIKYVDGGSKFVILDPSDLSSYNPSVNTPDPLLGLSLPTSA